MGFKSHIWKKKHRVLARSRQSHELTRRVDRVWSSHCTDRSFEKPEPVQLLGRPSPGSTRQANPGLIIMIPVASFLYIKIRSFQKTEKENKKIETLTFSGCLGRTKISIKKKLNADGAFCSSNGRVTTKKCF